MKMKCFTYILYWFLLLFLCEMNMLIIIKRTGKIDPEDNYYTMKELKESKPRELTDGDEGKNPSLHKFRETITKHVCESVKNTFPELLDDINGCYYPNAHGLAIVKFKTIIDSEKEGDEDSIPVVTVKIQSPVGRSYINVELCSNETSIKQKLDFLLQANLIKIKQLIFDKTQVKNIITKWTQVNFVPFADSDDEKKESNNDRKLSIGKIKDNSHKPYVLRGFKDFTFHVRKGVTLTESKEKNIRKLKLYFEEKKNKKKSRKLENLDKKDNKYFYDRATIFPTNDIRNPHETLFAVAGEPEEGENILTYTLIPSKYKLNNIKLDVYVKPDGDVTLTFSNASFTIESNISLPTERFFIKMLDVQIKTIRRLCDAIANLDTLYNWQDPNYNIENPKQQRRIYGTYEVMFPSERFKLDLLEKSHNNHALNQYRDRYPTNPNPGNLFIVYTKDASKDIYTVSVNESNTRTILFNEVKFTKVNEHFSVTMDRTTINYYGNEIRLGTRYYLDMSLFNQNQLANLYIDFLTDVTLRISNFEKTDPIFDFASPFAVTVFSFDDEKSYLTSNFERRNLGQLYNGSLIKDVNLIDENLTYKFDLCEVKKNLYISYHHTKSPEGGELFSSEYNTIEVCSYKAPIENNEGQKENNDRRRKLLIINNEKNKTSTLLI